MNLPLSTKVRGLVDCDSFYANCEVYRHPDWANTCVCIGKDVIIARNYTAKAFGIKVGTPVREAKKILPSDAHYVSPDIAYYKTISQKLMSFLIKHTKVIQQFSIDEAFFDITDYADMYNVSYEEIAKRLKESIQKNVGIPVSIGLAPTKILAKMFAEINKPFGECVGLDKQNIYDILKTLPLEAVPFIGRRTQAKLASHCQTAYDFACLPYTFVRSLLGKSGLKVWYEVNCINATSFAAKKYPRGIHRSRSFHPHFTNQANIIWERLSENIDKAIAHLHHTHTKTRYIKLFFRTKEFKRFSVDKRLPDHTDDIDYLITCIRSLFATVQWGNVLCRTTGIYLGELEDSTITQHSLFDQSYIVPRNTKSSTISRTPSYAFERC